MKFKKFIYSLNYLNHSSQIAQEDVTYFDLKNHGVFSVKVNSLFYIKKHFYYIAQSFEEDVTDFVWKVRDGFK